MELSLVLLMFSPVASRVMNSLRSGVYVGLTKKEKHPRCTFHGLSMGLVSYTLSCCCIHTFRNNRFLFFSSRVQSHFIFIRKQFLDPVPPATLPSLNR